MLLLDKPQGLSSNRAVQIVKRLYGAGRVGHTGTLDPLATGLLVVVLGEATKFAAGLLDADKSYDAAIRLGVRTSTGDAEGAVLGCCEPAVSEREVGQVIAAFKGEIEQVPPMHSALKKNGRPLYAYARAGESVARAPRKVTVHALEVRGFDGRTIRVSARVGKGTYLRSLAEDIGRSLGCGAHLAELRRTRVGRFGLERALTLAELEGASSTERDRALQPVDAMLADLPRVDLDRGAAARFGHGQEVALPGADAGLALRVYGPGGEFLGRGRAAGDVLRPDRLVGSAGGRTPCRTP